MKAKLVLLPRRHAYYRHELISLESCSQKNPALKNQQYKRISANLHLTTQSFGKQKVVSQFQNFFSFIHFIQVSPNQYKLSSKWNIQSNDHFQAAFKVAP